MLPPQLLLQPDACAGRQVPSRQEGRWEANKPHLTSFCCVTGVVAYSLWASVPSPVDGRGGARGGPCLPCAQGTVIAPLVLRVLAGLYHARRC